MASGLEKSVFLRYKDPKSASTARLCDPQAFDYEPKQEGE